MFELILIVVSVVIGVLLGNAFFTLYDMDTEYRKYKKLKYHTTYQVARGYGLEDWLDRVLEREELDYDKCHPYNDLGYEWSVMEAKFVNKEGKYITPKQMKVMIEEKE